MTILISKFRFERDKEYLIKRKTLRNITTAIIFSKLIQRNVKMNVVLTSHVLLIYLKSILQYELNFPVTNLLSHALI